MEVSNVNTQTYDQIRARVHAEKTRQILGSVNPNEFLSEVDSLSKQFKKLQQRIIKESFGRKDIEEEIMEEQSDRKQKEEEMFKEVSDLKQKQEEMKNQIHILTKKKEEMFDRKQKEEEMRN